MKVQQVVCDNCKRVKQEANNWHKIGVLKTETGLQLTLGTVPERDLPNFEVHDACGLQCFHKHIDVLLFGKATEGSKPTEPPPLPPNEEPTPKRRKIPPSEEVSAVAYTGV